MNAGEQLHPGDVIYCHGLEPLTSVKLVVAVDHEKMTCIWMLMTNVRGIVMCETQPLPRASGTAHWNLNRP